MAIRPAPLLDYLHRLASQHGSDPAPDAVLLDRFRRGRDEAAFAAIVARHGPMVLRLCRRLLNDAQAAEDAFQATFLVLARRASAVRPPEALAAWLHEVAYRVAVKARGAGVRRRARETWVPDLAPTDPHPDPLAELSARELLTILDEEVQRLPAVYRLPVIHCCLEGRTQEETAVLLGLTPGSVKGRLERGRARLHAQLVRRGLALASVLGAVEVVRGVAPAAVPAPLAAATVRAAVGAGVPARVALLAEEGVKSMALTKVKLGVALLLAAGVAVAGTGMLAHQVLAAKQPPAEQAGAPPPPAQAAGPAQPAGEKPARTDRYGDPLPEGAVSRLGTLRFRVPDEVEALTFAPDGKTLAVSSYAGLFLMDAASGKSLKHIAPLGYRQHEQSAPAFSPDGKRVADSGMIMEGNRSKGVVRVWEPGGGGQPKIYGAEHAVWAGWSAEGEPLVVCLEAGALRLDELASGQSRRFECKDLPKPGLSAIVVRACAPAGKTLAVADEQGAVHVWDAATGRERCTVRLKGDAVISSLALSSDGHGLAALAYPRGDGAPAGETVQLWDAMTGKALRTLTTGQGHLTTAAFSPDGKTLATVSWDDVRFWDVATGGEQGRTQARFSSTPRIAFSPDGKMLATAEQHLCRVHLWDVATGKRHPEPVGHECRPHGTAFSPDGRRMATGGGLDGTIHIWDLATSESVAQVRRAPEWVRDVAFSRDGLSLFSTWTDDNLWVCDAATGERRAVIKLEDPDHPDTVQSAISMFQSADGKSLVAFSYYYPKKNGAGPGYQGTLITGWDTATRQQLFRRRRPGIDDWLAVSPDARVLAVSHPADSRRELGAGRGPMRLEEVATGELLLTLPVRDGQTWPLAFSPDGRLLASNNSDYTRKGKEGDPAGATGNVLRLWETATTAEVLVLPAGGDIRAAFSPDGRLLAVTAPAREILVWDLARSRERRRFKGFDATVTYLAFTPDSRRLISGLSDSTFLIWDAEPPERVQAEQLGADGLTRAWADLGGADTPRALRARGALAAAPEEALPLLKERLHPARATDPQRLRRLLADLDSEQFEVREKAQAALEGLSDLDGPALRQTLANQPTPEVRRRVEAVLDRLRGPITLPEVLRSLRAAAVLEDIGTPTARQLLEDLAAGASAARLTREAKASLERLAHRPDASP